MSLADLVDQFIANLRLLKRSPMTVKNRAHALKRFISFLDVEPIERFQDVSATVLQRYRLTMLEANLNPSTIELYLQAVRQLFDFLEKRGFLFENPARYFPRHKKLKTIPDVLTEAEVSKLLSVPDCTIAVQLRDRAIMEVLYSCGLRRAELISLTIFDIDFTREMLRVLGKGRKERIVPIGKPACRYLKVYIKNARPQLIDTCARNTDAMWWTVFHKPLSGPETLTRTIANYGKKAGIKRPISPHTFRRTCATHLLQNGAHPVMVAELLGHSELKVLSKYLNVTISDIKKMHAKTKVGK